MIQTKTAILKKPHWRGLQTSSFLAYWPAGTEVQVYRGRGRKSYTVILPENE